MFRLQSAALPCKLFIHFSNKLGTVRVTVALEALKAQKNIQRILQCRRGRLLVHEDVEDKQRETLGKS